MRATLLFLAAFTLCACSHSSYTGQVSEVRQLRGGMVIDLNGTYPNQAMIVYIPRNAEANFAGNLPSVGDEIAVKGSISQYKGRPEIVVTSPAQLGR